MKKFLSLLLIPYLLVFINSKYVLVIDNTSFEFTLEENDVAKQFKKKFPLTITMLVINDCLLEYYSYYFWTTYFHSPSINYQPGYINAYYDPNYDSSYKALYISLNSGGGSTKNIGKIKEPDRLKSLVSGKTNITVLFTEEEEEEEEKENKGQKEKENL